MRIFKGASATAALLVGVLAWGAQAHAVPLKFTFHGDPNVNSGNDLIWMLDSHQTPTGSSGPGPDGEVWFQNVPGTGGDFLTFFTVGIGGGGFTIGDATPPFGLSPVSVGGDQIFDGPFTAPIFKIGSFKIDTDFNLGTPTGTPVNYSLTVTAATPVPAALPLLVTALAGLGFAGWRRKTVG